MPLPLPFPTGFMPELYLAHYDCSLLLHGDVFHSFRSGVICCCVSRPQFMLSHTHEHGACSSFLLAQVKLL